MKPVFLFACLSWFCVPWADKAAGGSPAFPFTHVVAEAGAHSFFIMSPSQNGHEWNVAGYEKGLHHGEAYVVKEGGTIKKIWETSGWYAFPGRIYLSTDGASLARFVQLENHQPLDPVYLKNAPALKVYRNGKLVRTCTWGELVENLALASSNTQGELIHFIKFASESPEVVNGYRAKSLFEHGNESADKEIVDDDEYLIFETVESRKFIVALKTGKLVAHLP